MNENIITIAEIAAYLGCSVEEAARRFSLAMQEAGITEDMARAAAAGMAVLPVIDIEDLKSMGQ